MFCLSRHIQLQWKGLEMFYLYCSPCPRHCVPAENNAPDFLQHNSFPGPRVSMGELQRLMAASAWWCILHPWDSLLSSNFQGQGTDVEAEEEAAMQYTTPTLQQ